MNPAITRALEAAASVLEGRLGPQTARERMAQVGSALAFDGALVLASDSVPSFADLVRPVIRNAREARYGGHPLTDAEIDELARAVDEVLLARLRVHCPFCFVPYGGSLGCNRCAHTGQIGTGEPLPLPDWNE